MVYAYQFSAKTRQGLEVNGLISAGSIDFAYHRVKKMGFIRPYVRWSPLETLKEWLGVTVAPRDLARFYRTLGKRISAQGSLLEALASAQDYLLDPRLKSMVAVMHAGLAEGELPHQAMQMAGFPVREVMIVQALGGSGNISQAFLNIAEDIEEQHRLRQDLDSLVRTPKITLIGFYLSLPVFFIWVWPQMMHFFSSIGSMNIKVPGSIQAFYDFVGLAHQQPLVSAVIYLLLPVLFAMAMRSSFFQAKIQQIWLVRELTMRSEHAALWSSYALMLEAGVPPAEIATVLSKTVTQKGTQLGLLKFSRRIQSGEDEGRAIEACAFPSLVVAGFRAAVKSGSLGDGLKQFSGLLKEDAQLLTLRLSDWVEIASKLFLCLLTILVFFLVLYPTVGPIISNF